MRALAVTLLLAVGCASRAATIRRTDAVPTEALIDSSDASTLYLTGPSGNMLPLDQHQVASIDHPGNVMAVAGGISTAVGVLCALPLVVDRAQGNNNGNLEALALLGIPYLLLGLPVFIRNVMVWEDSKARAAAFESARPPAWMIAPAVPGRAQRIPPLRSPPDGSDHEEPDPEPRRGFHR